MRDYKKYEVWQKAHELTLSIYKEVISFMPASEQYSLTNQIRRATYSIPMNIAEGCGRNSDKDFLNFLNIALGSAHELEYSLLLIKDLEYIQENVFLRLSERLNEIKAKLINLIKSIRNTLQSM